MKKTYAYTRYTKTKTTNASGSYLAGQIPTFLGVTLNMDDKNRDYRQAQIEYNDEKFRVRQGEMGRRDMIDLSTGEPVISLNTLLDAGEIIVYELAKYPSLGGGEVKTITSMGSEAPPPVACETPGPTPCGHCKGTGKVTALVDCADRSQSGMRQINCSDCQGLGTLTPEYLERRARGRELRSDRVARGLSLREEAERLGIKPRELNDLEFGRLRAEGEVE